MRIPPCLKIGSKLLDLSDHPSSLLVLDNHGLLLLLEVVVLREDDNSVFFKESAFVASGLELDKTCEVLDTPIELTSLDVEENYISKTAYDIIDIGQATHHDNLLRVQRTNGRVPSGNEHALRDFDSNPVA